MIRVDIGVAANKNQSFAWWGPVMGIIAEAWKHGIELRAPLVVNSAAVDHNRNAIAHDFRKSKWADWLWFIDDDTPPPLDALRLLLDLRQPYCAGPYFYKTEDKGYAPLIYMRESNGRYKPFTDYRRGEIVEVDSVGMGCTLIHRMVFEGILAKHDVGLRENGSVTLVRKGTPKSKRPGIKVGEALTLEKYEALPFFLWEHGRTEDHYFAELAEVAGYKPVVDTMIECGHIGEAMTTGASCRALKGRRRRERSLARELSRGIQLEVA